jgi:hypothetical protein
VTIRETGSPAVLAARQAQAQSLAADIRVRVGELIATDQQTAAKIVAAAEGLGDADFTNGDAPPDSAKPTIQMVDNQEGGDPSPQPPARGLPPEGVDPPVDGPLTPGPASRPSEAGKGGQSLWDKDGGEWRYFPGDKWHNPHWDYNGHGNPKSPWDNIPINGLPPRIGEAPPIISGLPPWLLKPRSARGNRTVAKPTISAVPRNDDYPGTRTCPDSWTGAHAAH